MSRMNGNPGPRATFSKRKIASIALVVALVAGAAWWAEHKKTPQKAETANSGYVDPKVCESCHADVAKTYRKSGMSRSFSRPNPDNLIEDYTKANSFVHKASGLKYTMIARDGKFYQRRSSVGSDGRESDVLEEQVDYVIGSGNHARAYLHRTQQGKLIQLPVSWYVENSGSWYMSPGFDRADQLDMHGTIAPECVFCHTGYPMVVGENSTSSYDEQIFPLKLAEGIDCQRCHGPGAAHVAAASSKQADMATIRSKIVNPARLSRERQLEVCMECHLETSAHHTPSAIRNYDRDLNSFCPGEQIADYKLYFERPKDEKVDDFETAHASYELPKSACFRNSQMTCLTCHDPHDIPRGEEARKEYIGVCEGCHKQANHKNVVMKAGSDCLSCHMPKRRTEGSVRVVLTDHYIQRNRPQLDLLAPFPEKNLPEDRTPVEIYYPKPAPQNPKTELYLAVAQVNDQGIDGIGRLQALLDQQHPQWPEPYVALGRAYARAGNNDAAIRSFDAALQRRSTDRPALLALTTALLAANQFDRAISTLQQAIQHNPQDDALLTNLGNAYLRQGKVTEAQDALSRAIAANPEQPDAHNLLGLCAVQLGNRQQAEQSFREAIRLQPTLAEPQNNLANLLTGEQRYDEAEFRFRKALTLNPQYADAHHGLGLLLILTHHEAEAANELEAAALEAPGNPQIHTDLADLLSALGRLPGAAAEYRRALELNASQPDANLGLGMILLQQGDRGAAVRYLMTAAAGSDPEVSQHAQNVLAQVQR
jgi:predicted CXXCH cytochrome family protein